MNFRITAYIASGANETLVGTVQYYRASEPECISILNDLTLIPFPSGDYGDSARIVGAVYHKRDADNWRFIDSSETLARHMDWSDTPRHGQPT